MIAATGWNPSASNEAIYTLVGNAPTTYDWEPLPARSSDDSSSESSSSDVSSG